MKRILALLFFFNFNLLGNNFVPKVTNSITSKYTNIETQKTESSIIATSKDKQNNQISLEVNWTSMKVIIITNGKAKIMPFQSLGDEAKTLSSEEKDAFNVLSKALEKDLGIFKSVDKQTSLAFEKIAIIEAALN